MSAVEDLTEVATRAASAECVARSIRWQDRSAVERLAASVAASLAEERALLRRPGLAAMATSPGWSRRLHEIAEAGPASAARAEDEAAVAARADADATAAVTAARIALGEAHLAVLHARLATLDAGDDGPTADRVRGYAALADANPVLGHVRALGRGVRDELRHIVADRPRSVALRLGISLGIGLATLAFIRLYQWDVKQNYLPYLALYALSGVLGGIVCTNALSADAAWVRAKLLAGARLWHVMIVKNLAILVLVGTIGFLLSALIAWRAGDGRTLVKSCGLVVTMMFLWLGIGNVLSIASPLRDEPLAARLRDGTLVRFLLGFAVSYVLGLGVNLMLYWRIWAKQTLIEQVGGIWLPVLLLVASAVAMWLLLTVLAVSLAEQPRVRRILVRELVEYRKQPPATAPDPAAAPAPTT